MRKFTAYRLWLKWDELQGRLCDTHYEMACICMMQKMRLQGMYWLDD